ncbi:hypothetical protein [Taylorella asinigenitalis]|uniref:hypothetical protein n=1 Tax=Taylorella asinigenitalis TaxID=84590 RepID=UPI000490ED84|nr:hypothetical protein [Taylorella asinigenitalis]
MRNLHFLILSFAIIGLSACSGAIYEETDVHFTYNCTSGDGCPKKIEEFKNICSKKYNGTVIDTGRRGKYVHLRCRPSEAKKPKFKIFNPKKPFVEPKA